MSKHTPEPWFYESEPRYCSEILGLEDRSVCVFVDDPSEADVNRIISCVNACAGMDDPAAEIAELKRQRDELLNLVKRARLEWLDQNQTSDDTDVVTPYDHVLYRGDIPLGRANANRIVTCVNACVGMEDPAAEIEKLKRQRDELLALARAVVCHSTVKDVMGVKCAAFPWTEYEGLAAKVKEISDES